MDLHEVDQQLFTIWEKTWNLKWLKPSNQEEEMKKFFENDSYDPQFLYEQIDFNVPKLDEQLENIEKKIKNYCGDELIAKMLRKKAEKLHSWLAMLATRGTDEFTKHSLEYYGKPCETLIKKAELMLENNGKEEERQLTSEDLLPRLQHAAKNLGLSWKIKIGKISSRADCVIPEKTLYIGEDATFSERDIKKLAVHELAVHARRAENGRKREYKLFLMGTAEYEATEEGLAGFMEGLEGVATKQSMKRKAALVLLIDKALKSGFRETFNFIKEHFPKERAFRLVVKVKRGLGDTSKQGAFTKDYLYLKGLEIVRRERFIDDLFWGRIAVEDLELLKVTGFIEVLPPTTAQRPASTIRFSARK